MSNNFGHLVLAILCPPLYFFIRGRWVAGIIHSGIYLLALITLIFGVGFLFWLVGVTHAMWDVRVRLQEDAIQRQAEVLADKMGSPTSRT